MAFLYFCNPSGPASCLHKFTWMRKWRVPTCLLCLAELMNTRARAEPRTCPRHLQWQWQSNTVFFIKNKKWLPGSNFFKTNHFRQAASPTTPALVTKTRSKCWRLDRKNSNKHQTPRHGKSPRFGKAFPQKWKSIHKERKYQDSAAESMQLF